MKPLIALLFIPALVAAQTWGPVSVAGIQARPGEKASGMMTVPTRGDSGTQIPITIIRGRQAGPTLALIAGTHGSEVAPIVALQRLRASLDPAQLRGTVILVHVANMPSYLKR